MRLEDLNERTDELCQATKDAERTLLADILIQPRQIEAVRETVTLQHFIGNYNRRIFAAMLTVHNRGDKVDTATINEALGGKAQQSLSALYAWGLETGTVAANAQAHAKILISKSRRWNLLKRLEGLTDATLNRHSDRDLDELIEGLADERGPDTGDPTQALDLVAMLDAKPQPIPWAIPNWLVQGSVTLLGGEDKAGKSTLAVATSLALVSGQPWLGEIDAVTDPVDVAYCDEENPPGLLEHRLPRIIKGLDIPADALSRLHYVNRQGLHFDEPEGYARLLAYLREIKPAWVVIDTLSQFHSREENSNPQMAQLYREKIRPLQTNLGCSVLVLHHLSKPSKERPGGAYRIRGASSIPSWCDEKLLLTRDGGAGTLTRETGRWGGKRDPLTIKLIEGEHGDHFEIETQDDDESRVLHFLAMRCEEGALRTEIRDTRLDGVETRATRVLKRLFASGRVVKSGNRKAMRYYLPEHGPEGSEGAGE